MIDCTLALRYFVFAFSSQHLVERTNLWAWQTLGRKWTNIYASSDWLSFEVLSFILISQVIVGILHVFIPNNAQALRLEIASKVEPVTQLLDEAENLVELAEDLTRFLAPVSLEDQEAINTGNENDLIDRTQFRPLTAAFAVREAHGQLLDEAIRKSVNLCLTFCLSVCPPIFAFTNTINRCNEIHHTYEITTTFQLHVAFYISECNLGTQA